MGPYREAALVEVPDPPPMWWVRLWRRLFGPRFWRCQACGRTLPIRVEHLEQECQERQVWIRQVWATEAREEKRRIMALTLERIQSEYDEGFVTKGEVMMFLSNVLTDENLDVAVRWMVRHPEFEHDLSGQPAREWWSSSGHRYVLTDEQFELMGRLAERVRGAAIWGPDGIAG